MSVKQAGSNRKPGGGNASGSGIGGGGRQNMGRGRSRRGRGRAQATEHLKDLPFEGIYSNMHLVHILRGTVGSKCELQVKNGGLYEGIFKTYGPKCDLVLDAAHRKPSESNSGPPKREDVIESIIFKSTDVVVAHFKDVDLNFARRVPSETDAFIDSAIIARVNGDHKEKDLEPWDGGDTIDGLDALESDVSNGWDPNEMFRYNEENHGVRSTYDSSLSSYTVQLERENTEEYLKREARAAQLAEEIESSAQYRARVALENDDRSEEEKYTAVQRSTNNRDGHANVRDNKYIPPSQRNRDGVSWASSKQNSPRLGHSSSSLPSSRSGSHSSDFSPNSGTDQRVVNGGVPWPSPCPSPSSRPSSRYQSSPNSLPPRAATPTRPPSRPPSRPSRPPSHPSAHGSPAPVSTMPKRMSSEGPPRMSPKAQRHPRVHRPSTGRGSSSGVEFGSQNLTGEVSASSATRNSPSSGTWSAAVTGGSNSRLSPKTHRPISPRQNNSGSTSSGQVLVSSQSNLTSTEPVSLPVSATSPTSSSPISSRVQALPAESKESHGQEQRQSSAASNKENVNQNEASPSFTKPGIKDAGPAVLPELSSMFCITPVVSDHRKQIDDLKKFKEDFRLQASSTPDPVVDQLICKSREVADKSKDAVKEKTFESSSKESVSESSSTTNISSSNSSKPSSPSISPTTVSNSDLKRVPDVTSQGVQTSGPCSKMEKEEKEDKENTPEQVRKSTLNPNAKEFNPRVFAQPKPSTTPTSPRPQGQPSPSLVGHQQPTTVYGTQVCFAQVYPVPVSPGGMQHVYPVSLATMPVNPAKPYRAGKVPNMPQQRPDQHHSQGPIMHPTSAAGHPLVAASPAYSPHYVTFSPQHFPPNQPVVHVYQSQHPSVYNSVIQNNPRIMVPPAHAQPGLVSSSATQYGASEQTHAMYVTGHITQQFSHPNHTLHHPASHPQPAATPTGQQQGQHGGNHPASSPVQHHQHQTAQGLSLTNPQQQPALYHTGLNPTPPGSNAQSPQSSFPSAQPPLFIHPSSIQTAYSSPPHMAHMPQPHVQTTVQPHHPATHASVMLMATQNHGGPQTIAQSALQPIQVSSNAHFPYMTHPPVQPHQQQQHVIGQQ
ncbi:ataxin-2 [Protopterus annectens]|uniref:ataxin-2 n=1 Tax=Protopterus annectens TaxID=7888 RepID=UPI001CFAFDD1|nr:ataxin-2 [Protopterus annectens]